MRRHVEDRFYVHRCVSAGEGSQRRPSIERLANLSRGNEMDIPQVVIQGG